MLWGAEHVAVVWQSPQFGGRFFGKEPIYVATTCLPHFRDVPEIDGIDFVSFRA